MEEEIIKGTWQVLLEAFPPQALVVILLSWVVSFYTIRALWQDIKAKEKALIDVSIKAVEVFDKIDLIYDNNESNIKSINKILSSLEVLKDRIK